MSYTGANLFTDALEQYGVTRVFGNPGTTELPIMNALSDSDLAYVLGLHEDVAVGMAAGYAKTRSLHAHRESGINPVGIANLHVAPGLAHGIGNIFDSSLVGTGAPIVVTAGSHPLDHQHHEPNLGADLVQMADQFTKWSAEVKHIDALPTMVRRAVRTALTPPTGPVFLSLPLDVMIAETDAAPERLGSIPNAGGGDPDQLSRAVDVLADADEPVLIVGDGVARSGEDAVAAAVEFAEATGVRVHSEFKSSEVSFPADHEQWAGGLPRDQELAAEHLNVDVVVFAGVVSNTPTNPPEVEFIPDRATSIHVNADAWEIGKNYVADVGLIGDPGIVLTQIADRLEGQITPDARAARLDAVADTRRRIRERGPSPDREPDSPLASNADLAAAMHRVAPDARIIGEAPTSTGALWDAYEFEPEQFLKNRGGGLGYGLPAAIGTAIAERDHGSDRDVIAFIGDGSYLYYPHALYSAARYGIDLTVVIPDNRNYRILKDNTLRILGGQEEEYDFVGMDFDPPVDIPKSAESHGASGRLVEDPDDIEDALASAIAESGPTVLDVLTHD